MQRDVIYKTIFEEEKKELQIIYKKFNKKSMKNY